MVHVYKDELAFRLGWDFLELWGSRVITAHYLAALRCSPTRILVTSVSVLEWLLPWKRLPRLPPSPCSLGGTPRVWVDVARAVIHAWESLGAS